MSISLRQRLRPQIIRQQKLLLLGREDLTKLQMQGGTSRTLADGRTGWESEAQRLRRLEQQLFGLHETLRPRTRVETARRHETEFRTKTLGFPTMFHPDVLPKVEQKPRERPRRKFYIPGFTTEDTTKARVTPSSNQENRKGSEDPQPASVHIDNQGVMRNNAEGESKEG